MNPVTFKEHTKTLQRPETMTDEECQSLDIYSDGQRCISLWRPGFLERFSILFFGRVWLCVHSGTTQPPVWVSGMPTVFEKPRLSIKRTKRK